MTITRGITASASVAGNASGSSTAITGTATMLAPNPTDPWTRAPIVTAASAIAYSSPDKWIAPPPWQRRQSLGGSLREKAIFGRVTALVTAMVMTFTVGCGGNDSKGTFLRQEG